MRKEQRAKRNPRLASAEIWRARHYTGQIVHLETSGCYPIKPTHKKTLGVKGPTKKKKETETTNRKGKKRQHTGGARNLQKKETLPRAKKCQR
jgi:hypothetical protein